MSLDIRETYWKPLEGRHKAGAWEVLDAGYTEPHRAYHTWEHVASLLKKLNEFSNLSIRSDIIATSVIWHDAVHRTQNDDGSVRSDYENVRESGALFRRYTLLSRGDADAVYDLIMATANHLQARAPNHHYPGFAGDFDLFLDLDLSSLASPWEDFAEDLTRIRSEYSWAPEDMFCLHQIRLLENFAREDARLYRRTETREKWSGAAKANLRRCLADLKRRIAELSSD
jgi:predicted metal-dependent HD superfamily phosphohydrolase